MAIGEDSGTSRRAMIAGLGWAGLALALPGSANSKARAAGVGQPAKAYRAIRYARSVRYGPAEPVAFSEALIQTERGPISPQLPSRLAVSNGPQAPNRQDEQCQVLSVFTPSRRGKRPVLVFLHGGAFLTGGGELPWYDGDRMAGEQDIVVVSVSYRLGAFGFWLPKGSSGMSPAYTDMLAALNWIKLNIAKFGGDPDNVTLSGQSAGAVASYGLTDWGYGQSHFRRIICESGLPLRVSRTEMERHSRQFDELLGIDPHTADIATILKTQAELTKVRGGDPGWRPVAPDQIAPFNVDIVAGWAREDAAAMASAGGGKPSFDVVRARTLETFGQPNKEEVTRAVSAGRTAYLYSFDWEGAGPVFGNCHCIELSFLYGNREAWKNAPMLAGTDWTDHERLGRLMRAQWAAFARRGNPTVPSGPRWIASTSSDLPITSLA